jgi:hypothetical protein
VHVLGYCSSLLGQCSLVFVQNHIRISSNKLLTHPCCLSCPAGPSQIALRDCAYGLARYAAIAQHAGLVPIVEPEVLLDGDQDIDQ